MNQICHMIHLVIRLRSQELNDVRSILDSRQSQNLSPKENNHQDQSLFHQHLKRGLAWIYWLASNEGFEPVYSTITTVQYSPLNKMLSSTYLITKILYYIRLLWVRLTSCSGVVVIILLLNEFEQSTILMVSYVICKASFQI